MLADFPLTQDEFMFSVYASCPTIELKVDQVLLSNSITKLPLHDIQDRVVTRRTGTIDRPCP
jgi:hypothetical protein